MNKVLRLCVSALGNIVLGYILKNRISESKVSGYLVLLGISKSFICVMGKAGCQGDPIWNQLKPRHPGTPVNKFSWLHHSRWNDIVWIIWGWKTHNQCEPPLLVVAYLQDMEEGRFYFCFSYLHSCWQVCLPCCRDIPLLALELTFMGFRCRLRVSSDTQADGLNNYRVLAFCIRRLLLLN